jgi:uncharacterized protein YndB with AHSA1/START domain
MQQLADTRSTLHITHHYAASPARVFDAWLTPQLAGLWLFATASRPMVKVAIDARAGGAFCFVERRTGKLIEHRGHYIEIMPPLRLVFMLRSPDCAPHATRVTAEFTAQNTGCALELIHDGLPADRAMSPNGTSFGARAEARWTGMLYGLGVVLAHQDAGK